jgi:hypothetical protein
MGKSSHSFSQHPNSCRRLDLATPISRRSGPDKSTQRGHYIPSRPGMEQSVIVSTMGSQSTPHLGLWTHQPRTLRWSRQSLSSRNPALRVEVSGTCRSSQSYAHMPVLALISSPAAASCCHVSCPAPTEAPASRQSYRAPSNAIPAICLRPPLFSLLLWRLCSLDGRRVYESSS